MLNIIVAVAHHNVIGMAGKMPWHLPAELQYFKRITMGKPIIMGRKTFDSIGRALPGRRNIVVTRNQHWQHDGVETAHSLEAAITMLGDSDAFVIGGATLYQEALMHATTIYLTRIDAAVEGDTFFPDLPSVMWQIVSSEHRAADEKNAFDVDFTVLSRR
jgi:dihydrofolate reductase